VFTTGTCKSLQMWVGEHVADDKKNCCYVSVHCTIQMPLRNERRTSCPLKSGIHVAAEPL